MRHMPTIKTIFLYDMFGFGWNGIKLPVNRYYAVAITNQLDEWIINHCRFAGKQNVKWYTLNHNKLVTRGIRQTTNFDIIEQALSRLDISYHFSISKICLAFFFCCIISTIPCWLSAVIRRLSGRMRTVSILPCFCLFIVYLVSTAASEY